ncbi:MAG: discoidin domain-containing protein [bacterium]
MNGKHANDQMKVYRPHLHILIITSLLMSWCVNAPAQVKILDNLNDTSGWNFIRSDGVDLNLSTEEGLRGKAVRFDYDFTKGTGYGGIQKLFPIDLPANYEFTFYLKAESPANNFEIKFVDSTGNNVWWLNNRNYDFPREWTKIRIRKRHISFAWGPMEDQELKRIDRIEFTIASFVGGKGTIWLDSLTFEPLPPETKVYPEPVITSSSSVMNHPVAFLSDGSAETYWLTDQPENVFIDIDFKGRREFGGLHIDWLQGHHAEKVDVLFSDDDKVYDTVYSISSNQWSSSFIRLPEAETHFVRLVLSRSSPQDGIGIAEIKFPDIEQSLTPNDFLIYVAKNASMGDYPRYLLEQASYWTVIGVNNDEQEGLINEDGLVEHAKGAFSVEPMIRMGGSLYNWSNVSVSQSLGFGKEETFRFQPAVTWTAGGLEFVTSVTSGGEANKSATLLTRYLFRNHSEEVLNLDFYLLIRPFQVNPYYQWLNLTGGVGKINSLHLEKERIQVDGRSIYSTRDIDTFGASSFDEGNLAGLLREGRFPAMTAVEDRNGLARGVISYSISLKPGEEDVIYLVSPFYGKIQEDFEPLFDQIPGKYEESVDYWKDRVNNIRFNLPPSADRIINAYKANLVYILINKDRAGIQPGSRSYERSWIRDGALTSSALLKSGIVQEVKDFIDWYVDYQYESGKVPCVVDFRGPDPVPENDSHGELIYLIREYFNFTGDTAFLRSKNSHVIRAVDYIESLVAERSTDHYRNGNDSVRAHYGLVPESISHEGYSAKPMHSYWDNFFTMKGLKDAAEIQRILGEKDEYVRIANLRDTFRENLYKSLDLAMQYKGIDFIPGCVELGDFDATSTTIALTPCNELHDLPKPQVYNTFDRYYDYFAKRREGTVEWINYTPYENRLIGSFILLDQPEKAHELIDFFLDDQRPRGWSHWAEVV